ncbi:MAG: calcium-translocating P-type ATPase, SERCA-type [Candidatus Geothermarchaeales archaeon]
MAESERTRDWHRHPVDTVVEELGSDATKGLSGTEAQSRLARFGPNELVERKRASSLGIFLSQFKNFLVIILIIAATASALVGNVLETIVILLILIAVAVIGFVQEFRAEKAIEAMKRLAAPSAIVVRDGLEKRIPARDLVPGDVILVRVGDKVPADVRLIRSSNLKLEEAPLTGESVPVPKDVESLDAVVPVADRRNMAFMGTVVTFGSGRGVVVGTGMGTEFGKIAGLLQEIEEKKTPLQMKLNEVGRWLGVTFILVSIIVASVGVLTGRTIAEMVVWGISLAVAAVPEALPAVVVTGLALGVQRMARKKALVRRLPSVEALGSTTVICSDKTGTLTKNEMTVRKLFYDGKEVEVTGRGYEPVGEFLSSEGEKVDARRDLSLQTLLRTGVLCNEASLQQENGMWHVIGDPTEGALLTLAAKADLWKKSEETLNPRIGEISFEAVRKMMTTIHATSDGGKVAYIKGAPEVVLSLCSRILRNGKEGNLRDPKRKQVLEENRSLAAQALRVLAIAYRSLPPDLREYVPEEMEKELVFVGLVAMMDPPREEAREAVERCKTAGIRPVMVTGDHKDTGEAIARELGMMEEGDLILEGTDFEAMLDEELDNLVERVSVYARVAPEHKIRIVRSLKKRGHVVAMTGDGINDAPALKASDIGVSMGITGTDVTKEASDMILLDDNFSTIVAAVEEGRSVYDNIQKYIAYLLQTNIAEIAIMFFAVLLGFDLPLFAIQILWINLVTDGLPALALSFDPADPDIMERPPRDPEESIFTRSMKLFVLGIAVMYTVEVLVVYGWLWIAGETARAMTMAFTLMAMLEMATVLNARSLKYPISQVGPLKNRFLIVAILFSVLMQLAVVYIPPLQSIFHTVPLGPTDWYLILGISAFQFTAVELAKFGTVETRVPQAHLQRPASPLQRRV